MFETRSGQGQVCQRPGQADQSTAPSSFTAQCAAALAFFKRKKLFVAVVAQIIPDVARLLHFEPRRNDKPY